MNEVYKSSLKNFRLDDPVAVAAILELVRTATKNAAPIKDLVKVPKEVVDNLYELAIYFYNLQKYAFALEIFEQLIQLDITSGVYPLGAGACQQALGKYLGACAYYGLAAANDPQNPNPLFYAAEVSLVLGKKEAALNFYEQVIKLAADNKAFASMKNRAEAMIMASKQK